MERELKLVLDAAGYFRLASCLPGYSGERWLANHYFDTRDRALRSRGAMLRIRETEAGRLVGLKQAASVRGGAFEAAEWELPLHERDWVRVVRTAGDLGILDHPVIREGFALARAPVLPYQGALRVLRKRFHLSNASTLELDLVCFEDGSQDWELEVETERPEAVRPFLQELLDRRRVPWREQTLTKYERFLAHRGDAPPPPLCESAEGEVESIGEGVLVRRTPLGGAAVYATRRFSPGEVVLEIEGQPVGPGPRPPGRRWVQVGRRSFLDVTGMLSGRVRHSCRPAAGVRRSRALVALVPVEPGDEVTYDYAMTESEVELICVCGTAACRGLVGGYRRLPGRLRRGYRGWVSEYLLEEDRAPAEARESLLDAAAEASAGSRRGSRRVAAAVPASGAGSSRGDLASGWPPSGAARADGAESNGGPGTAGGERLAPAPGDGRLPQR